jgi:hypothetical protein
MRIGRTTGLRFYMPMSYPLYENELTAMERRKLGANAKRDAADTDWLRDLVIVEKVTVPRTLTNGGQKIEVH